MLAVEPSVAAERLVRKREGEAWGIAAASADGGENLSLAKMHHRRADSALVPRVVAKVADVLMRPPNKSWIDWWSSRRVHTARPPRWSGMFVMSPRACFSHAGIISANRSRWMGSTNHIGMSAARRFQ